VFGQLQSAFQNSSPQQIPGLLQQVVTAFDAITPPAELQADWQTIGNALRTLSSQLRSIDLSTPQGQQQYQQAVQQITASVGPAQQHLSQYVLANCTPTGTTTSAAASSS
jgi:hypothetical protein